MSRTVTLYSGWEIFKGAALGKFKHGQLFTPFGGGVQSEDMLEISNTLNKDFNAGSVILHGKKDKYGNKVFAKAFVWDLRREYVMGPVYKFTGGTTSDPETVQVDPNHDIMYCVDKEEE